MTIPLPLPMFREGDILELDDGSAVLLSRHESLTSDEWYTTSWPEGDALELDYEPNLRRYAVALYRKVH